ncbi:MAG: bifunctional diaminohydroxyphosphoribosylaminopyrimidine deaminase/5-amino-6-(5-phosphoribosylamino)uracil reductase RibD, partial [Proteobacteria bacterium]|nr:bifunctional diaminohydroxyphosphoribosylaminopyrimidine deaminase/5-amino-6-(5-phosphoribosylamino)uracil reductase RibD [Pseudomonadota bacterium]
MSRPEYSAEDCTHMARALRLAARGRYTAHPNPMVGCVLVKNHNIVGEGWHVRTGDAHAEINALQAAGGQARGATAYITLEPCAHHGKTPPCTDALIEAGVRNVIVATQDPFAGNAGSGLKLLDDAGIATNDGLNFLEGILTQRLQVTHLGERVRDEVFECLIQRRQRSRRFHFQTLPGHKESRFRKQLGQQVCQPFPTTTIFVSQITVDSFY